MVLAGLLLLGGFSRVSNPDYHYETVGLYLMILLCGGSVAGGLYLYKKGWQQGHDFANVMSILPAAVLVVLIAFGALAQATRHNPPRMPTATRRPRDRCLSPAAVAGVGANASLVRLSAAFRTSSSSPSPGGTTRPEVSAPSSSADSQRSS